MSFLEKAYGGLNNGLNNEYTQMIAQGLAFLNCYLGQANYLATGVLTVGLGGIDFINEHKAQKGNSLAQTLKPFLDATQLLIGLAHLGISLYMTPIGQAISNYISPEVTSQMNEFINSIYGYNPSVPLGIWLSNFFASNITIKAKTKVQEFYTSMRSKVKDGYEKLRNSELLETFLFGLAGANSYLATNNPISVLPLGLTLIFEKITDYSRMKAAVDTTGSQNTQKARIMMHNLTYPVIQGLEITLGLGYLAALAWYTPILGVPLRLLANKIDPTLPDKIDQFLMPIGGDNPMTYLIAAAALFNAARYEPTVKRIGPSPERTKDLSKKIGIPKRSLSDKDLPDVASPSNTPFKGINEEEFRQQNPHMARLMEKNPKLRRRLEEEYGWPSNED